MEAQSIILLVINVVGGIAVIGSYIHGFITQPDKRGALWGGIPQSICTVYGVSIILAALGYFASIYYILFRIIPGDVHITGGFGYSIFYIIFLGMLLPSSLWMPLTYSVVNKPNISKWIVVRIVLVIVGFLSCALVWALLNIQPNGNGLVYWFAIAGSAYFAFHTVVLDMIIWSALFKKVTAGYRYYLSVI